MTPKYFHTSLCFLGPRLTTLKLGLFSTATHLSFLVPVVAQCPSLEDVDLSFSGDVGEVDEFRSLSSFVQSLTRLKTLSVPSLTLEALHHIGRLSTFVSLTLTDQFPLITTTVAPADPLFVSLKSLELRGSTIGACAEIIALLEHAPIVHINLPFSASTPPGTIAQFYATLAATCSHGSVSELQLGARTRDQDRVRSSTTAVWINGSQLRPLLSFSNVTCVMLAARGFNLDDATLADMTRAWPQIQKLCFCSGEYDRAPPAVTLGGLLYLARYCPKLSDLELSLNAAVEVPDLQSLQMENERVRQFHLCCLRVFRSPIVEPAAVALFLSSVFPRLRWVFCRYSPQDQEHEHWSEVATALPTLRAARADEESWAARAK
ncbi:hypothetical protein MSAN_01078100 [Mycena sanguinolenta]|uniref:Uncharacterized protein n=1 Tax=Mycena sanguinolenta TaxID=230812 RepID=A0A8H6YN37_9AGAR|nr:hypothetical protein MSAN_01078100 [Mycena sanguinolenta]